MGGKSKHALRQMGLRMSGAKLGANAGATQGQYVFTLKGDTKIKSLSVTY